MIVDTRIPKVIYRVCSDSNNLCYQPIILSNYYVVLAPVAPEPPQDIAIYVRPTDTMIFNTS